MLDRQYIKLLISEYLDEKDEVLVSFIAEEVRRMVELYTFALVRDLAKNQAKYRPMNPGGPKTPGMPDLNAIRGWFSKCH